MNKQQLDKVIQAQKMVLDARRLLLDVQQDLRISAQDRTELTSIMHRLDGALMRVEGASSTGLVAFLLRKRVNL